MIKATMMEVLKKMQVILDNEVTNYKSDFLVDIDSILTYYYNHGSYNGWWFVRESGTNILFCNFYDKSTYECLRCNNKKVFYFNLNTGIVKEVQ